MKSKDQILLEEAYKKVLEQHQIMTPKQEARYQELTGAGYEFDYWKEENLVMTRKERGTEHTRNLDSLMVLPDGRCMDLDPQEDEEPEMSDWDKWDDMTLS